MSDDDEVQRAAAAGQSAGHATTAAPGFSTLLGLVLITLKLTGYINWDWKWVLAPLWMSAALVAFIILGTILFIVVMEVLNDRARARARRRR